MPDDAPTGLLVDYLKERGILTYEGQDDLNGNEAFEHLARHLGTHFDSLANFYEKVKRCVATGRGQRIDIEGFTPAERSAAVQFGTLLHRHGMLKDFYYHRSPKKQLRVIPTKDGQVGQFLTGGWLEIYVSSMLSRRLRAAVSPAKYQLLYNVKGALPDGREFEADVMAAVDGRLFWLECKTGNWQDYSARFRGLVPIFGVDRTSGALLLIKSPDAATRKRATDMLNMTLLSLGDVDAFISQFLGLSPQQARDQDRQLQLGSASGADLADGDDILPLGTIPPLSEEEIPLEDAEPARKLGHVDLDAPSGEGASPTRRRRRRRRGGRGRGRRGASAGEGSAEAEGSAATAPKGGLHEPVPIEPLVGDATAEAEPPAPRAAAESAAEATAATEGSGTPRLRRRRRRGAASPFAEGAAEAAAEEAEAAEEVEVAEEAETAAEEVKVEEAPVAEEPQPDPLLASMVAAIPSAAEAAAAQLRNKAAAAPAKRSAPKAVAAPRHEPEVTIAPDLAAMMAGGQQAKEKENADEA